MAANRFGIPAQVHEECLTGLAAWRATIYPSPLCWAATFDPATRGADGRPDRVDHASPRGPSGAGAGARRRSRPALGSGRGDAGRGPVPRRSGRECVRPGTGERWRRRHAQALRGVLRIAGWSEPRAGVHGTARGRRRAPAPLRDGTAGRRPVGDERLHRHRRGSRRSRPCAADHVAARLLGVYRHGRGRLLLRRLPAHPPSRGRDGRGRSEAGARGWHRHRASVDQRLRGAAAHRHRRGVDRREGRGPGVDPRAAAEVRARAAGPGLGTSRRRRCRPGRRRVAGHRPGARQPVGGPALQPGDPPAAAGQPARGRRPPGRHLRGDARLLLVPAARAGPLPGHRPGRDDPHGPGGPRRRLRRHVRRGLLRARWQRRRDRERRGGRHGRGRLHRGAGRPCRSVRQRHLR